MTKCIHVSKILVTGYRKETSVVGNSWKESLIVLLCPLLEIISVIQ